MAYLLNEEEEQQNQQQTPLLQNQSQMQGMGGGQNVLIRPSRMGTGFTNISQFLEANRQAGQQLTNRVVGNVQKDTAKATSGIQDVRQKVEDTRQSKQAWETDASKIQAAIEKAKDTSKAENLTDLENLVQGPQLDRTLSIMRGNTNVNELGEQFRTAAANLGANLTAQETSLEQGLGRELGRMGLVRRAIKSPTYTVGQMALDQTIMEGMGSQDLQSSLIQNRAQIGQTRQEALNLSDEQRQLAGLFSDLAKQKAQELQQLQKDTIGFTNQQIDQQTAQAEAEIALYEDLTNKILRGELSVDQVYSILNPNTGQIDPNWAKFFKTNVVLDENEIPRIKLHSLNKGQFGHLSDDEFINRMIMYSPYFSYNSTITDPSMYNYFVKPNENLFNTALANLHNRLPNELKRKREQLTKLLQTAESHRRDPSTPTDYERELRREIASVDQQIKDWVRANIRNELQSMLNQTRLATAQDPVYRQAVVNKFLRENFGLDTNTRLFQLDPTSLARVNREGLRDRVTTTYQARLLNALERLIAGETAKQLSLEGRGKTALDIIDHGNFRQRTQQALDKELQKVFSLLKDQTLQGTGRADYERSWFGDLASGHAEISAGINALDLLAQIDPETYKKIAGDRTAGDYYYFDRKQSGTAGHWGHAQARAREQIWNQFVNLLDQLGYNNQLQLGKKRG